MVYVSTFGFEHVFPGHGSGVPIILRLGSTFLTLFPQKGDEQALLTNDCWLRNHKLGSFIHESRFRRPDLISRGKGVRYERLLHGRWVGLSPATPW